MTQDFVYGIVEGPGRSRTNIIGLDGRSRVRIVASGGLGAVVSDDNLQADLRDLPVSELLEHMVAYQRVVEQVMRGGVVLPVRFGTRVADADEVRDLMEQNRTTLTEAFTRMRGSRELEVAATWDIGQVLGEIGREPEVVAARAAIEARGDPTPEDRVALGRLVASLLEARRVTTRRLALDTLEPLAVSTAAHALVDERMIMNEAFLLSAARIPDFEAQVRRLDNVFGGRIDFRIVGPLPPYTFCIVDPARVTLGEQQAARRTLKLPDVGDHDERTIRDAYRRAAADAGRAAAEARRERSPDADPVARNGEDLKGAEELLLDLARTDAASQRAGGEARDRWIAKIRTTGSGEISSATFGGGG